MAGPLRIELPLALYHTNSRGNERIPIARDYVGREKRFDWRRRTVETSSQSGPPKSSVSRTAKQPCVKRGLVADKHPQRGGRGGRSPLSQKTVSPGFFERTGIRTFVEILGFTVNRRLRDPQFLVYSLSQPFKRASSRRWQSAADFGSIRSKSGWCEFCMSISTQSPDRSQTITCTWWTFVPNRP